MLRFSLKLSPSFVGFLNSEEQYKSKSCGGSQESSNFIAGSIVLDFSNGLGSRHFSDGLGSCLRSTVASTASDSTGRRHFHVKSSLIHAGTAGASHFSSSISHSAKKSST